MIAKIISTNGDSSNFGAVRLIREGKRVLLNWIN